MAVRKCKTKACMVSELRREFLKKQGSAKARWVSNQLNKMSKEEVAEQYKRLKGKVSSSKNSSINERMALNYPKGFPYR
jgi:hypothetical protein